VAKHAGVGKATIYRHFSTKEAIALELLMELASPYLAVEDVGDTRAELLASVTKPVLALTESPFGPVVRALLSEIAINPELRDPFRDSVVRARRDEIAQVVRRGIDRGDLRPDADPALATELLVGPVYFRLTFGGALDEAFAERVVDAVLHGYAAAAGVGRTGPPKAGTRTRGSVAPRSRNAG
jgi:AcrR family transcriptional regulator